MSRLFYAAIGMTIGAGFVARSLLRSMLSWGTDIMTPSEYDRSVTGRRHAAEIRERYARAIAVYDVHEGRDRNGFLPQQRVRFDYWRKCGLDHNAAYHLLMDEIEAAERSVGG